MVFVTKFIIFLSLFRNKLYRRPLALFPLFLQISTFSIIDLLYCRRTFPGSIKRYNIQQMILANIEAYISKLYIPRTISHKVYKEKMHRYSLQETYDETCVSKIKQFYVIFIIIFVQGTAG